MLPKVQSVAQCRTSIQPFNKLTFGFFDGSCRLEESSNYVRIDYNNALIVGKNYIAGIHRNPAARHWYL